MAHEEILYSVEGTTAVVTINRPQRYDAFRGRTVEELTGAWAFAEKRQRDFAGYSAV